MIERGALIVLVRKVRKIFRDWTPDRIIPDRVHPIHRGNAVGLNAGELERILLPKNLIHRIWNSARRVDRLDQHLVDFAAVASTSAIELLREELTLTSGTHIESHHRCERHREAESAT